MTVPNLKMSSLNARLALARSSDSVTFSRMYVNTPGPGSRLLAMVRTANGGVFHCDILTDAEEDLVLHWGVSHGTERRDWTRPEEDLIPDGSSLPPGGASVETAFGEGPGTEGAALQRVTLDLGKALKQSPPITALQFVVRSDDASRWWKDGADNFVLPLPLPGEEEDPLAMEFAGNDVRTTSPLPPSLNPSLLDRFRG